ncbi:MAG: peptide deformylase [Clostridia bacterium]|nr:peptide deformylase [Clostridia bacterium]
MILYFYADNIVKSCCLSLLGGPRPCKRYKSIKVKYQNTEMQTRIKTYAGWTAQIIQHEVDHCEGILI